MQITFKALLEDKLFEAWVNRIPLLDPQPPWRLYLRVDGKWSKTEPKKYKKGLKLITKYLDDADDIALTCPSRPFNPPVLKDKEGNKSYWRRFPIDHHWCGYCRRPTRFTTFKSHHSLSKSMCTSYEPRCTVCGVRLVFLGNAAHRGLIT